MNFLGNPLISCTQAATKCNSQCQCDEAGYCTKTCQTSNDCVCGEKCVNNKCRNECSAEVACAQGQLCVKGACLPGCQSNNDCPNSDICKNTKCQSPCKQKDACGQNAICSAVDHRKVCLCPDGFQGDANKHCSPYECNKDEDCESNKKCSSDGYCRNPCLEYGGCGTNAQCRVVDRQPLCTCPLGYIGNPLIECKLNVIDECSKNPCGRNANCRALTGTYECSCAEGCTGDPYKECNCDKDLCKNKLCGTGAQCRVISGKPQCICPSDKAIGDPTIECEYKNIFQRRT